MRDGRVNQLWHTYTEVLHFRIHPFSHHVACVTSLGGHMCPPRLVKTRPGLVHPDTRTCAPGLSALGRQTSQPAKDMTSTAE